MQTYYDKNVLIYSDVNKYKRKCNHFLETIYITYFFYLYSKGSTSNTKCQQTIFGKVALN